MPLANPPSEIRYQVKFAILDPQKLTNDGTGSNSGKQARKTGQERKLRKGANPKDILKPFRIFLPNAPLEQFVCRTLSLTRERID